MPAPGLHNPNYSRCGRKPGLRVMLWMFLFSGVAAACPVCASPTGDEVREGIRRDFWPVVAQLSEPFLLLGSGLILYHRFSPN